MKPSARPLARVGIVGCGVISQVYAEKLSSLPFVELAACADLARERAEELAAKNGIPRVLGVEELMSDPAIDLVLNLTVPLAHVEVSQAALEAGKSVYSEKPLALDFAAAHRLAETAERRRVRLGCAPDTFLGAGMQTCRRLIDAGAIGEPVAANAFVQTPGPESWHPRPHIFYQRGGGPLFDVGPYYLTALVFLLGPARRITGAARISRKQRRIGSKPHAGEMIDVEVATHVVSAIDFASGPIATLVTSFDVQASRSRNIEIFGSEATLSVPDPNTFGGPVQIRRRGEREWTEVPLSHANAKQARGIGLGDMVAAQGSGRPHRASGELALHVTELMEGSLRASETGRHVELTTTCARPAPLSAGLADDVFDD